MLDNPTIDWNYELLSFNANISWEIVLDNPQIKWNYDYMSFNPNITWDIVCDNPQYDWNYLHLLDKNQNITWDIIEQNPTEFDYPNFSFGLNFNLTIQRKYGIIIVCLETISM